MVGGSKGLGGVFDDGEVVLGRDGVDGGHVGCLTVNADGHDGFGIRRDSRFDLSSVHVPSGLIDVDEDWGSPEEGDHFRCGNPGVRDGDDFIAWADAEGHERDEEGVRAASSADAVLHAHVVCKAFF